MGSGKNTEQPKGQESMQPPPAYQEKEPLPDTQGPVVVPMIDTPVVTQPPKGDHCRRRKGKCCCYCCTVMVVLIVACTILPIAIVKMSSHYWWQSPSSHIELVGVTSRNSDGENTVFKAGSTLEIKCEVNSHSHYMPLVQWFHDADETENGEEANDYKLIGIHNKIVEDGYKTRYHVHSTIAYRHSITYVLKITNLQLSDAGRFVCQVPQTESGSFDDEYQKSDTASNSSEDDDDHRHHRRGCHGHRNSHVTLNVEK